MPADRAVSIKPVRSLEGKLLGIIFNYETLTISTLQRIAALNPAAHVSVSPARVQVWVPAPGVEQPRVRDRSEGT